MALINQFFSADHDRLDCIYLSFKQLFTENRLQSQALFSAFTQGLNLHIAWEEKVLFPFFEQNTGMSCGPTRVMREEHIIIKQLLDKIASAIHLSDKLPEQELAALEQVLLQHNQKEESILYPMIDRLSDDENNAKLFLEMTQYQQPYQVD